MSVLGFRSPCELDRNRLLSGDRQTQGKDRALVDLACDRNCAAVGLRDFLDDRQPKFMGGDVAKAPLNLTAPLEPVHHGVERLR